MGGSQITGEARAPVGSPEELVPGINPAFLSERLAVPMEIADGVVRWGLADPNDADTLAALRFASRAPIATTVLAKETILALLGDGERSDAVSRIRSTSHADAVVELRSHLIDAFAASAERIEIDAAAGTLVVSKGATAIVSRDVGTTKAQALADAADALVAGAAAVERQSRLSIAYRDARVWVSVEPHASGVALVLNPNDKT